MTFANWTIGDLLRSALDRSARDGAAPLGEEVTAKPMVWSADGVTHIRQRDGAPIDRLGSAIAEYNCNVIDLRTAPRAGRGVAHGTRPIGKVTAICWHQMAAVIDDPNRCLGIPCHIAVVRSGDVVLLHPLHAYVWHGHAANSFSVGVEIACRAAGTEGDPRTFWRSRSEKAKGKTYEDLVREATPPQITSAFAVGVYITEEIDRLGGQVVAQMFHRNSHSSRTTDPGSRIALNVALPLAHRFGHEYGGPVVGSGHPTPDARKREKA